MVTVKDDMEVDQKSGLSLESFGSGMHFLIEKLLWWDYPLIVSKYETFMCKADVIIKDAGLGNKSCEHSGTAVFVLIGPKSGGSWNF